MRMTLHVRKGDDLAALMASEMDARVTKVGVVGVC
jgi:hypothetical protein